MEARTEVMETIERAKDVMSARPGGVYVIKDDDVQWRPAVDVNKVIIGGQIAAIAALLLAMVAVRARKAVLIHEIAS